MTTLILTQIDIDELEDLFEDAMVKSGFGSVIVSALPYSVWEKFKKEHAEDK